MRRSLGLPVVAALMVVACAPAVPVSSPSAAPATNPPVTAAPSAPGSSPLVVSEDFAGQVDIGGYTLFIDCMGEGTPAVIFEAGLNGNSYHWTSAQNELSKTTRSCWYSRAGLNPSQARPRGMAPKEGLSAGFMAGEEYKLLQAAGIPGPYVVVGHSYGGMVARLFAFAHPAETAGVVLVDASSEHQYEGDWLANDDDWLDGATRVDRETTRRELEAITSLGDTPLVVLTQSDLGGDFEADWSTWQDELAALSTNSLHMIAWPSGHMIMQDQGRLMVESIRAAVEAARADAALPVCDARFSDLHAICLESTMTARVQAWAAERNAVVPNAGTFPAGTYVETVTRADFLEVGGFDPGFEKAVNTWTFKDGRWQVRGSVDGGPPEFHEGWYSATGDILTLVVQPDWKTPQTSGVYTLRFTKDNDGTIHFDQIDEWPPEADFAVPYIRTP